MDSERKKKRRGKAELGGDRKLVVEEEENEPSWCLEGGGGRGIGIEQKLN